MSGAQSSNGTTEAETNLKITLKVQELLEQSGCTVILTRSDENAIYSLDAKTLKEKKVSDIRNRVKIGNNSSADIFVSIHLNKIPQPQYSGWQCFYQAKSEQSQKLAKSIQKNRTTYKKYETGTEDTYGEGVGRVYESDEDPLDLYSQVEGKIEIKIR